MRERFSGVLGTPDAAASLPGQLARLQFAAGALAYPADVATYQEGGRVCLALGRPRFRDAALQQACTRQGAAAAWAQAFARFGDDAVHQAAGRFCVVMVADDGREALLATDRFGTWPICYAARDGRLHFSDRADTVPGVSETVWVRTTMANSLSRSTGRWMKALS